MKIMFYGKLSSLFGPELDMQVQSPCTIGALRTKLAQVEPGGGEWLRDRKVRAVVGGCFVDDLHELENDDAVEFLAPVSGG